VLHSMLRNKQIAQGRVQVQGFADTKPLEDNATPQGRAKNRRVELVILRGSDIDSGEVISLPDGQ